MKKTQESEKTVEDIAHLANLLEANLEAHGILARTMEVNVQPKYLEFQLEVVRGVAISEFEKLSRDIALFLASPTGKIDLVAPIPGTHRIGINLPRRTSDNKQSIAESKPAEIIEREKNIMYYLRNFVADLLFLIVAGLVWLAQRLHLSDSIETLFVSNTNTETPIDEA